VLVGLILEAGAITTATNAFLKLKRAYFSGKLKSAHLLDDLLVEVKGSDIRSAIRKRGVEAAAESNTPSMTTQWKCRWRLATLWNAERDFPKIKLTSLQISWRWSEATT
jgi:hypothetical protein